MKLKRETMTMKLIDCKLLDWHLGDIEQWCGFRGGKYTDVKIWFALHMTTLLAWSDFLMLGYVSSGIRKWSVLSFANGGDSHVR